MKETCLIWRKTVNEKTADVPGVSWTCTGDLADAPGRASCLRGARERRLETLVQSEETVQVRGQVQDYEIKDNSKSYLITSCVLKNQENEIPVKKLY